MAQHITIFFTLQLPDQVILTLHHQSEVQMPLTAHTLKAIISRVYLARNQETLAWDTTHIHTSPAKKSSRRGIPTHHHRLTTQIRCLRHSCKSCGSLP